MKSWSVGSKPIDPMSRPKAHSLTRRTLRQTTSGSILRMRQRSLIRIKCGQHCAQRFAFVFCEFTKVDSDQLPQFLGFCVECSRNPPIVFQGCGRTDVTIFQIILWPPQDRPMAWLIVSTTRQPLLATMRRLLCPDPSGTLQAVPANMVYSGPAANALNI